MEHLNFYLSALCIVILEIQYKNLSIINYKENNISDIYNLMVNLLKKEVVDLNFYMDAWFIESWSSPLYIGVSYAQHNI